MTLIAASKPRKRDVAHTAAPAARARRITQAIRSGPVNAISKHEL